jgi:hypothetical protein
MNSVMTAALLALAAAGCASPMELAQRGQLTEAYLAAAKHPETQAVVAAAIVRAEAPVLTVEAIEGEALAKLVGPSLARELDPAWIVLRGTLKTRAQAFPHARFDLAFGREGAEVASFAPSREALVIFTKEKLPQGHAYNKYGSRLCDNIFTCLILLPVVPFTLEKRGEGWTEPTEEEFHRDAPRAFRVAELLRDRCDDRGSCVRHLLLRRPRRADEPLRVRARIGVSKAPVPPSPAGWDVSARVTVPLEPAARFAARFPVVVDPAAGDPQRSPPIVIETGMEALTRDQDHFCKWKNEDAIKGGGGCLVDLVPAGERPATPLGLAMPPRPPALGTPEASSARRPWWAEDGKPALDRAPARQAATADTEMVVCTARAALFEGLWIQLGPARHAVPWPGRTFMLGPVHLPPDGKLVLTAGHTPRGEHDSVSLGTITLTRRGSDIEVGAPTAPAKNHSGPDISCTPWDRDALEAELARRWVRAVEALDLAEEEAAGVHFSPDQEFGEGPTLRAARVTVAAAAEPVGWDDPRVAALVTRADAIEARRLALTRAGFDAWAEGKLEGKWPFEEDVALRVEAARCDAAPGGCTIEAVAQNRTDTARNLEDKDLSLALADGRVLAARLPGGRVTVAPRAVVKVTITTAPRPPSSRASGPFAVLRHPFVGKREIVRCSPPK